MTERIAPRSGNVSGRAATVEHGQAADDILAPEARNLHIPRRELVTLLAYLETGSHKAGAHRLGISESTSRQRVSSLMKRVGARNAAQAVWALQASLERETQARPIAEP